MPQFNPLLLVATMISATALLACTPALGPTSRVDHSPDSVSLCSNYGFASGTQAFESCTAKLDRVIDDHEANERRCQMRAQTMTPPSTFPSGFRGQLTNPDPDYRLCLSEHVPPPVQLELPSGQTVTCQQIESHVHCY